MANALASVATPPIRKSTRKPFVKSADYVRRDIYAEVTAKIILQLEAGIAPWVRPWGAVKGSAPVGMPHNADTGRAYSGVNVLLLWGAAIDGGYQTQGWLTYKAAQKLGGTVRAGQKGTSIVYASKFVPEAERAKGDEAQSRFFLKSYTVFNVEQCDLPEGKIAAPVAMSPVEQHEGAQAIIAASGAVIRHGGDKAFYMPSADLIQLPPHAAFHDSINYYRTAFHELSHWTGAKHRLDRKLLNSFGTKDYAREELVAEMSSAFMCATLGIEPTVRHADYLANWLAVLREDNRAIFTAASQASKAANYLHALAGSAVDGSDDGESEA